MQEKMTYETFTATGNGAVEIIADKETQFVATDLMLVGEGSDIAHYYSNWVLQFGIPSPKLTQIPVAGEYTCVVDILGWEQIGGEFFQEGTLVAIRSKTITGLFVRWKTVVSVDSETKTITFEEEWNEEEIPYFGVGSEVIPMEENKIPLIETEESGVYALDRTGECVLALPPNSPALIKIYGSNGRILISGYYNDIS